MVVAAGPCGIGSYSGARDKEMREIVSGIEAELSSLTVKTTGHKCPNGNISESLVKQFGEGEVSVVIIC